MTEFVTWLQNHSNRHTADCGIKKELKILQNSVGISYRQHFNDRLKPAYLENNEICASLDASEITAVLLAGRWVIWGTSTVKLD